MAARRRPRRDDEDEIVSTFLGIGSVGSLEVDDTEAPPVGRLFVPDPEQRRGWREVYVRPPASASGRRPIGFGR